MLLGLRNSYGILVYVFGDIGGPMRWGGALRASLLLPFHALHRAWAAGGEVRTKDALGYQGRVQSFISISEEGKVSHLILSSGLPCRCCWRQLVCFSCMI